jgi:hypothetical protein
MKQILIEANLTIKYVVQVFIRKLINKTSITTQKRIFYYLLHVKVTFS